MITERVKQPPGKRLDLSEAKVGLHKDFQIAVVDVFKIKIATTSENVTITAGEMNFEITMERGHGMDIEAETEAVGGRLDVVS